MIETKKIVQKLNGDNTPVMLVGIMGCGKTHIGRMLARELDLPFIDTDKEIEHDQASSISDIFENQGEETFRTLETKKIQDILSRGASVVSTGGGAFAHENSRTVILGGAISIWLDADIETLFERVSRNDKRPLLRTENPKETLTSLLAQRASSYKQANIHVKSDHNDLEILEDIKKSLYAYLNLD